MPSGGRSRSDTPIQSAARQRTADSRKCFFCGRRSAMSARKGSIYDSERGVYRECNYCGAVSGVKRKDGNIDNYKVDGRPEIYVTTYCNFAHNTRSGKPIKHECRVIPPEALHAEIAGDFEKAIAIMQGGIR